MIVAHVFSSLSKVPIQGLRRAGNRQVRFRAHELREIQSLVVDSRQQLLEAWNEFFGIVGA
jgi:hypothetical protein